MNKHRWLNSLIGLLLFLSACGSPTPAAAPTNTPALASPTIPAATFTAIAPPGTLPATATLAPTATAAPSSTPSATPDPLHTACDHPYWPLRLGAMWVSKTKTGVMTTTVTAVTGDLLKAQAIYTEKDPDGTLKTVQFLCDKDGLAFGDATNAFADGHVGTKKAIESTGRVLIPVEKMVPGAMWAWSLTANFSSPSYDSKGVFTQQTDYRNVSSQSCTFTKTDVLTLTVGIFRGLWVDCKGSSISTSNGTTATYPFSSQVTYALGVGPFGDSLVSYSIP